MPVSERAKQFMPFKAVSGLDEALERKRIELGVTEKQSIEEKRMLTGKQRANLKKLANEIDATVYIGKNELTDNIIKEISDYLEAHELVKVKLQENVELDPKDVANEVAEKLGAEYVQAIGRKFVLYKESKDHKQIIIQNLLKYSK